MIFTQEEKIFIVESYFRNGHLVDGVWQYSIQAGFVEFSQQFADATGLVDRKKSSGHPKKSTDQLHDDEIIDGYFSKTVPLHTLYMNLNLNKSFWMNELSVLQDPVTLLYSI
ncbi:hypothetical protein BDFB_014056 [Asbolus verrucosus]|uniref:Uncharacterized protein n=1 Tax=Asbolus verrucosus TaxID=1661398 RepID=A0A482VQQ1_ASBVE|nr:hypothetical protein BDFB_014056 [Asbolus verrucosus]